ncbi:MAG TPA: hypothetical protein VJX69_02975 [Terriglobales bacterium]|nr:hypothetical protein [Terriglobales bacterium]
MRLPRPLAAAPRSCASLFLAIGQTRGWAEVPGRALHALAVGVLPAMFLLRSTRDEIYNILWALVFGFATLNILSLGARHFEQEKSGLSFGEILAILVVLVSLVLLGWEMLYLFHILPIRLTPR